VHEQAALGEQRGDLSNVGERRVRLAQLAAAPRASLKVDLLIPCALAARAVEGPQKGERRVVQRPEPRSLVRPWAHALEDAAGRKSGVLLSVLELLLVGLEVRV
jgi:hypothetical protein